MFGLIIKFLLLLIAVQRISAQNYTECDVNNYEIKNMTDASITLEEFCKDKPCVAKCCPPDEIYFEHGLVYSCTAIDELERNYSKSLNMNYSTVPIYNTDIKRKVIRTQKTLDEDFNFIYTALFTDNCSHYVDDFCLEGKCDVYILEDGRLLTFRYNFLYPWNSESDNMHWCFEHAIDIEDNGTLSNARILFRFVVEQVVRNVRVKYTAYQMAISCFFLFLVLLVYILLKDLRNLPGMMMMAFVVSLLVMYVTKTVQVLCNENQLLDQNGCIITSLILYYSINAIFLWMNVMSYDIWWTLSSRGFRNPYRGRPRTTFCLYALYAWGVALIPVLFVVIVDNLDLTHLKYFVQPRLVVNADRCFFSDENLLLYVGGPILIVLSANTVLFMLTIFNIRQIKSGAVGNSKSEDEVHRFYLYFKLAVVMGINWIFELLSITIYTDSNFWYITDAFNALIGLVIFILFVCKRKVLVLLCERFSIDNKFVRKMSDPATDLSKTKSSRLSLSILKFKH